MTAGAGTAAGLPVEDRGRRLSATEVLRRAVADGMVAGGSLIVRRRGRVIEGAHAGLADRDSHRTVTEQTLFRIASMTKPVVAVAVLQLVEAGRLDLDVPVARYLPLLASATPGRQITVRDLLAHRSGLGQGRGSEVRVAEAYDRSISLADRVVRLSAIPADFEPGRDSSYSPLVGFEVLGRVIEVVTGDLLESHLRTAIFDPLGMPDTTFTPTPTQLGMMATLYEGAGDAARAVTGSNDLLRRVDPIKGHSGSAGLVSTLRDYDRFVCMLAGRGRVDGDRILSASSVRAMRTAQTRPVRQLDGTTTAWGLGVSIVLDGQGRRSAGSWGWSGAFGTHFYIDPSRDETVVLMVHQADIGGAGSALSRDVEAALATTTTP